MEAAAAALAAAEQRKAQLSEELTMLVMQSSGAQMRVSVMRGQRSVVVVGLLLSGVAAAWCGCTSVGCSCRSGTAVDGLAIAHMVLSDPHCCACIPRCTAEAGAAERGAGAPYHGATHIRR